METGVPPNHSVLPETRRRVAQITQHRVAGIALPALPVMSHLFERENLEIWHAGLLTKRVAMKTPCGRKQQVNFHFITSSFELRQNGIGENRTEREGGNGSVEEA